MNGGIALEANINVYLEISGKLQVPVAQNESIKDIKD
ncbi:MAG: hypothetical protein BTN85_0099 [Candidatus Methanohalarchaeum thermophilum]|uniref:Uncharacterized protein n=1 Tax=Methanohalarchaeum thermophilum TaxID=1903181 RepID=A0A1Q6DTE9_METT1|nr:MAG: hypothetical protein BTN85_0099 [Candidatus Methanohalarchaeum thermophilum]